MILPQTQAKHHLILDLTPPYLIPSTFSPGAGQLAPAPPDSPPTSPPATAVLNFHLICSFGFVLAVDELRQAVEKIRPTEPRLDYSLH